MGECIEFICSKEDLDDDLSGNPCVANPCTVLLLDAQRRPNVINHRAESRLEVLSRELLTDRFTIWDPMKIKIVLLGQLDVCIKTCAPLSCHTCGVCTTKPNDSF